MQAAPDKQQSTNGPGGRQSHPSVLLGLSAAEQEATKACKPGEGKQRDHQRGDRAPRGAQGPGHSVSSACTRQPLPSAWPLPVTYSSRMREFPVALARGIQIDVFTLTSLLTGVFTLGETG